MGYDVPSALSYDRGDKPVFVSVRGDSDATEEITEYWRPVRGSDGPGRPGPGPLGCPLYGMLTDRFGVIWVLDVPASY